MQLEVRAYTSAMSQILTGRRPYWTRLRGDPGGREQFYHEKLVAITPTEENYDLYIEKVAAACTIQRAVRNLLRIRRLQRTWMRPPSNMAIRSALEAKTQAAKQKITRTLSFVRPRSSKNLPANKTVSMEDLPPSTLSEVKSGEGAAAAGVDQWQDVLTEVEVRIRLLTIGSSRYAVSGPDGHPICTKPLSGWWMLSLATSTISRSSPTDPCRAGSSYLPIIPGQFR